MSDLLGRLIDRATGAPSRVEPVLPSRYESVGAQDAAGVVEQTVTRERDAVAPREDRANQQTTPEPARVSVGHTRVERVLQESGQEKERPRVAPPPAVPLTATASASVCEDGLHPSQPVPATNIVEPRPSLPQAPSHVEQAEVRAPGSSSSSPTPAMIKIVREESRPQASSYASAPPNITQREAAAPVEVQVTIGHIEVRTAPAPAPIPQRRISRPTVSLEDYLRRRNGGAR